MKLFVYGSLLRGQQHHARLSGARFLGQATTEPLYELFLVEGYPALVPGGTAAVRGELYEVSDALLRELDAFEDVPALYERQPVAVGVEGAVAYVMPRARAPQHARLPITDWRAR